MLNQENTQPELPVVQRETEQLTSTTSESNPTPKENVDQVLPQPERTEGAKEQRSLEATSNSNEPQIQENNIQETQGKNNIVLVPSESLLDSNKYFVKDANGEIKLEFDGPDTPDGNSLPGMKNPLKLSYGLPSGFKKQVKITSLSSDHVLSSYGGSPLEPLSPVNERDYSYSPRDSSELTEEKKDLEYNMSRKVSVADFKKIANLGQGSYAEVTLVQDKNGNKFALKAIDKNFMIKEGKSYQVNVEKEVLSRLSHPNIIKLHLHFQEQNKLYFLLEYVPGGEFSDYLKHYKKLPKEQTQFFAAEIVSFLEYLHTIGIAHRDLKPGNIMVTLDGHLKAIDFGTAKLLDSKVRMSELFSNNRKDDSLDSTLDTRPTSRPTFVGTAQYVSPEMLGDSECGAGADLWALGVMIYQMEVGKYPFSESNEYLTFQKIQSLAIDYPDDMDPEVKDILQKLLIKEPEKRLGAGPKGSENDYDALKNHPFFKGIDFEKLPEMKPPVFEIQVKKKTVTTGSDKKKEEVGKIQIREFPKTPSIIDKDITITLSGLVEKKCGWIFYKPRQLILNSKPRLMYYDPNTNQLRGEIHLAPGTKAELESKTKFNVTTPLRKYKFKQIEHSAEKWVNLINSTIEKLYPPASK